LSKTPNYNLNLQSTTDRTIKFIDWEETIDGDNGTSNMVLIDTALSNKVNNSQVLTNVPSGAVFTDTITSINGKTGVILKADIVALGIPAQDTTYSNATTTVAGLESSADKTKLDGISGTNTGDETVTTIKTKLGITTLSGSNTGDQTLPVGGTPALTLGTSNIAGISANFLRRDDTILAFDTTVPSTQAFGDSASVGTAIVAARRDHKHAMPASTKDTTAITGILKGNGSAISAATSDTDYQSITNGQTVYTAIVDNDYVSFYSSANTGNRKSLWSNIKSVLKAFFDTIYASLLTIIVNSNVSPALGTVVNNNEYRCTNTTLTTAPTMTLAAIASTTTEFVCAIIFKAPNSTAPVITNNSGYTLKYIGQDVISGTWNPVANTVYRMSIVFDGIYINVYVSGVA